MIEPILCPKCEHIFLRRRHKSCPKCKVGLKWKSELVFEGDFYLVKGKTWIHYEALGK